MPVISAPRGRGRRIAASSRLARSTRQDPRTKKKTSKNPKTDTGEGWNLVGIMLDESARNPGLEPQHDVIVMVADTRNPSPQE